MPLSKVPFKNVSLLEIILQIKARWTFLNFVYKWQSVDIMLAPVGFWGGSLAGFQTEAHAGNSLVLPL